MPNPPPPQAPNFNPGVGRLATDRYDFEAHIEGTKFRHKADQIDLFPTLVIGGTLADDVQDALELLTGLIAAPVVPQATIGVAPANLGIVTLGGDFGGNALTPKVTGLQGFPIQNIAPLANQVLSYNGSFWAPVAAPPPGGVAGGDLGGSYPNPTVIKLQSNPVSAAVPGANQFLQFVAGAWTPTTVSSLPPSGAAGGDLGGSYPNPTVAKLQGTSVSGVAPLASQALIFNGVSWAPSSAISGKAYYGTGVDGSDTFTGFVSAFGLAPNASHTYFMTQNISCVNMTINVGATVVTQGFVIMCTGTLTNNGTIDNSGSDASGTTQGAGAFWSLMGGGSDGGSGLHFSPQQSGVNFAQVNGGAAPGITNDTVALGGRGGTGGNISNLAGTLNNPIGAGSLLIRADHLDLGTLLMSSRIFNVGLSSGGTGAFSLLSFGGGTGGGGGASPGGGPPTDGGGGGGGGGIILICANILAGNGIIQSKGGNGANATAVQWAGGGGGGGGVIAIIFGTNSFVGLFQPIGGNFGNGPNGPGMPGIPGSIVLIQG